MSETLGYADIFDGEFYSCRLGAMKPDPNYFHAILKSLPYQPEQLLFIDDRQRNIAGAQSIGVNGVEYEMGEGVDALRSILREYGLEV